MMNWTKKHTKRPKQPIFGMPFKAGEKVESGPGMCKRLFEERRGSKWFCVMAWNKEQRDYTDQVSETFIEWDDAVNFAREYEKTHNLSENATAIYNSFGMKSYGY